MFPLLENYIFRRPRQVAPAVMNQDLNEVPRLRETNVSEDWVDVEIMSETVPETVPETVEQPIELVQPISAQERRRRAARERTANVKALEAAFFHDADPEESGVESPRHLKNKSSFGGGKHKARTFEFVRDYGNNGPQRRLERSRRASGKAVDRKVHKAFHLVKINFDAPSV